MEKITQASRIKAARALTPPTAEELAARTGSQEWSGLTTTELSRRLQAIWPSDSTGGSYAKLRNVESLKHPAMYNTLELPLVARALEVPLEFFTLSRSELLERLEGQSTPEIEGETGRELRGDPPKRADRPQRSSRAKAGKKRAGA